MDLVVGEGRDALVFKTTPKGVSPVRDPAGALACVRVHLAIDTVPPEIAPFLDATEASLVLAPDEARKLSAALKFT